jgi:hypothetical protein
MTTVEPLRDGELGEVAVELDLRDLVSKVKVVDEEDGGDEVIELLVGDGESAVAFTSSWTTKLEEAADHAERVGNDLHHLAVVLRERAERRRRAAPAVEMPPMGTTPER